RGTPRYPLFSSANIVAGVSTYYWQHSLAVGAKDDVLVAALIAKNQGRIIVERDWVEVGDPRAILLNVAREASFEVREFRLVAGPEHHKQYDVVGLKGAASRLPMRLLAAGDPGRGREIITQLLTKPNDGRPWFAVVPGAGWTLRAMLGGADAVETMYKPFDLLLGAIESAMAMSANEDDGERRYMLDAQGRRYLSSHPKAVAIGGGSKSDPWADYRR